MNLLIDSKLCVTPTRITVDDDPELPDILQVTVVVIDGDDSLAIHPRRRSSRRAYRSAPSIDAAEPCMLRFKAPEHTSLVHVDVPTPYGVRRDFCLDGETLYSQYLTKSAA